jgi:hypothetical protein
MPRFLSFQSLPQHHVELGFLACPRRTHLRTGTLAL